MESKRESNSYLINLLKVKNFSLKNRILIKVSLQTEGRNYLTEDLLKDLLKALKAPRLRLQRKPSAAEVQLYCCVTTVPFGIKGKKLFSFGSVLVGKFRA